jgi:hypothetical protein
MDCSASFDWLPQVIILVGAGIGTLGSSSTIRRSAVSGGKGIVGATIAVVRALFGLIGSGLRRAWDTLRRWGAAIGNRFRSDDGTADANVELKPLRVDAVVGTSEVTGDLSAIPGLENRIAALEQDQKTAAWWYATGFALIVLGTFLGFWWC